MGPLPLRRPGLAATSDLSESEALGTGFAIPANKVKLTVPQLIQAGGVTKPGRDAIGASGATANDSAGNPMGVAVAAVQRRG